MSTTISGELNGLDTEDNVIQLNRFVVQGSTQIKRFLTIVGVALAFAYVAVTTPTFAYEFNKTGSCPPSGQRWDTSRPIEVVIANDSVLDYFDKRGGNAFTDAGRMFKDVQAVVDLYNSIPGSGLVLTYGGGIEGDSSLDFPEADDYGAQRIVIGFTDQVAASSATAEAFAPGAKADGCTRTRAHVMFRKTYVDGSGATKLYQWVFGPPDHLDVAPRAFVTADQPLMTGARAITFLGILTHEMGHALGLAHPINEYAIMAQNFSTWFRGQENVIRSGLLPDDEAGIRVLYGNGSPADRGVRLSLTNSWVRTAEELTADNCSDKAAALAAAENAEAEIQAVVDNLPDDRGDEIRQQLLELQAETALARAAYDACVASNAMQRESCKVSSRGDGWADREGGVAVYCGTNLAQGSQYPTVSNRVCPGAQVQLRYTVNNHSVGRDITARAQVWLSRDEELNVHGRAIKSPDTRDVLVPGGASKTIGQVFRLPNAANDGRSYRVFVRVIPHDPATGERLWSQEADKWDNAIMVRKSITVASSGCN